MKFKINKIEGSNTWVTFTFDDGTTSDQTLANLPVFNPADFEKDPEGLAAAKAGLKAALEAYGTAYVAGLASEQKTVLDNVDLNSLL
jgi:hypothetical protein